MPEDKAPGTFSVPSPAKRAPGRPKGAANKAPTATSTTQDVRQAMAALDSLYNITATALLMLGLPETLTAWSAQSEKLRSSNEDALKAAPKLATFLANAGNSGGATTLVFTHALAFAGVAGVARTELAERRRVAESERAATTPAPDRIPGAPVSDAPTVPDLSGYIPAPLG